MVDVLDYTMRPQAMQHLRGAMRASAGSAEVEAWRDTMDALLYLSMWLADAGMERERDNMHRLYAGLFAAGLEGDLEVHPVLAGACLVPAEKADFLGLFNRIDNRSYVLRNVLRGRARLRALATRLAQTGDNARELAWCVAAMVLMGTMELDPRI